MIQAGGYFGAQLVVIRASELALWWSMLPTFFETPFLFAERLPVSLRPPLRSSACGPARVVDSLCHDRAIRGRSIIERRVRNQRELVFALLYKRLRGSDTGELALRIRMETMTLNREPVFR